MRANMSDQTDEFRGALHDTPGGIIRTIVDKLEDAVYRPGANLQCDDNGASLVTDPVHGITETGIGMETTTSTPLSVLAIKIFQEEYPERDFDPDTVQAITEAAVWVTAAFMSSGETA